MSYAKSWLRASLKIAVGMALAGLGGWPVPRAADLEREFSERALPHLKQYCVGCHSTEKQKGELDLEQFSTLRSIRQHPKVWQSVVEQIQNNEMPPKDKPQPAPAEREQFLKWVGAVLDDIALSRAGDPGPVVLRRLSNAEYTYTLRDLTGVESLDPAHEFPVDSASGEGFANVGNSLVMSPALITKYLDAAKEVTSHLMLLPDGLRFSPKTTRRDWTEELLAEIRQAYREYTDAAGGTAVNLQGIKFETNEGGRLPVEKYLAALLEERATGRPVSGADFSPKYLALLRRILAAEDDSLLLDGLRARWRAAKPGDAPAMAQYVAEWQHALFRFHPVGHIGKLDGPKMWMEPVSPLQPKQELRVKLPAAPDSGEVSLFLLATDAGDGNEHDDVVWHRPRLVAPGRPDLLLRDVRGVVANLTARRERLLSTVVASLEGAAEAAASSSPVDVQELAAKHKVDAGLLTAWLNYLGLGSGGPVVIDGYFTNSFDSAAGYSFVKGWGSSETPNLSANSSDNHVRIPGNMKPHSVAVHPSPKLAAVIGWLSPVAGTMRVEARLQHAHPECGNGVTWAVELRRGQTRQRLASGIAQGGKPATPPPIGGLAIRPGDLVSLVIGARDGNHSCDLTAVDLTIAPMAEGSRSWDLAADVSPDVTAANPHADRFGHAGVWHFYTEPDRSGEVGPAIPAGSLLARWQAEQTVEAKRALARELQELLSAAPPSDQQSPDAKLHRQITSLGGPLLRPALDRSVSDLSAAANVGNLGLDPADFGRHPNSAAPVDPASLCVRAPAMIEIRLPADLVESCEFVAEASLHPQTGSEGSVQARVLTTRPENPPRLVASAFQVVGGKGTWSDGEKPVSYSVPILAAEGSAARQRIEKALADFRDVFPAALCYNKIVPVDEVVTLTLYYREDHQLSRLMFDEARAARLDRLWNELHFVSQDALALVDAYEQLWQYATQDADPKAFEPLRQPIQQRAAAFRKQEAEAQPSHLKAVLNFAERAYRRPLAPSETDELRQLYQNLRQQEIAHEEAIRLTVSRVLVAPAFLYRAEKPPAGAMAGPVSDWELATRLSYFLWSSVPDAELLSLAAAGRLRDPETLVAQSRRMLRDPKVRRLATEFGCAWLHIYDFDQLDEKSERHFPSFVGLRGAMYEESIRFFTDFFQRDRSVLGLLEADYTYLNGPLAEHYGIKGVEGSDWRLVEGLRQYSRGGILAQATTLAKQSGASRTSPILRGNWVSEVLLGERLPRPPKDVPRLPEDEADTEGLTVRQLVEKHSSDPKCSGCHVRIDPYGYALERFDAIGRLRETDLGGRAIDTRTKAMDGIAFDGLEGLRDYLLQNRGEAFLRQFCRKLLGYSLGRAVQLSDDPLLKEMKAQLKAGNYRITRAVETILRSRQFREVRGLEMALDD